MPEAEKFLDRLTDAAIVMEVATGRIVRWNHAAGHMFGYAAPEALGQPVTMLMPADMRARHDAGMAEYQATGHGHLFDSSRPMAVAALRRSGERFAIELSLSRWDDLGHFVLALVRDVSERQRLEDELREKERRFRGIFNQTFQFIGLLHPDGRVIDINQTALEAVGITLSDVIGRPFWQAAWWSHSPALQARLKQAIQAAAEGHFERFEATHPAADGSLLTIDFSLKPLHDDAGRVVMLIPEGRDITERKRVEECLQESERRFRAIFDGAGIGIVLMTLEGRFLETNHAFQELLGFDVDALRRMHFKDFTHPEDVPISLNCFQELVSGQRDYYKLDKRYFRKDGGVVWVSLTVYLIRDAGNQPSMALAIIEDVSARKDLEESLRQQNQRLMALDRLKSDFINAVSHDLRTPLTALFGYLEFLEDELAGPLTPEQRAYVQQVQKNGKRLELMVNDLLDVARFEAGTFRLNCETVDFRASLQDTIETLKPQIEAVRLRVEVTVPSYPMLANLDAERIERVVFNLLSNALKFTPEGGIIRVTAETRDGELYCAVTDTGVGIASEDLSKLFSRFSQLEEGKRKKGGTGLGLSISKSIVESHGGRIGVDSTLGAGSTFWFILPTDRDCSP